MNTPNPLVPQGSLQSRGKATVRTAFFTIAAIHVVFIGGLLIQGGCKKSEDKPVATEDSNALPPLPPIDVTDTNMDTNVAPPITSNPPPIEVTPPPVVEVPPVVVPDTTAREYIVVKGDSYSSIASKLGVSVRAIEQANPGVNPSRLQIGKKLQIPAPTTSTSTTGTSSFAANGGDGSTYTVKAGDMLEKIARAHGTTAKAIMQLNNLKTTMIKPGQKLKMPTNGATTPTASSPEYVTPLPPTNNP